MRANEIDRNGRVKMDVKTALKSILEKIPEYVFGDERQENIRAILEETSKEGRMSMKHKLDTFLVLMITKDASDIDLGGSGCSQRIWYRVYGAKEPELSHGQFTLDETDILIQNILSVKDQNYLFTNRFVDFSYSILNNGVHVRFRATVYYELNHLCMNMRLINNELRPLITLNLHENIIKLLSLKYVRHGLVLITGITGAGKSTTLDSIIDSNNRENKAHIVIISNPVRVCS